MTEWKLSIQSMILNLAKKTIRNIGTSLLLGFLISCSPTKEVSKYDSVRGKLIETGIASWYGPNFEGKLTANGEIFNSSELTAAHRTLSFGSIVRVVNKNNGLSVTVRINDRGPYASNRIIDLSKKAASEISMIRSGIAKVDLFILTATKLPIDLKKPHYTVQIGSFKNRNDAVQVKASIRNSRIVKAKVRGETYYRIYVGLFDSVDEAKELKSDLQNNSISGLVKQTEN